MRFGVDEAGKGPVLGSMFAAAVVCEPSVLPTDVDDSKDVPPDRRETLAAEIRDVADAVGVAEIPVDRIDDPATDMNGLTVAAHAEALGAALEEVRATVDDGDADRLDGTVDAGDTDADRFGRRVQSQVTDVVTDGAMPGGLALSARHTADASDPLVGAASIVAKVERDAHVAALADRYATRYGEGLGDLGSGYPSDPTTRDFLASFVETRGDLPDCARESWSTCADVLAAREQAALSEF